MNNSIVEIYPDEVMAKLKAGDNCQIVDVREPFEYKAMHIAGSKLVPMSSLLESCTSIDRSKPVFLLCKAGSRARQVANKLPELGIKDVRVIKGGLDAWVNSGYEVQRGQVGAWSLERQVRITAGALVLLGIVLAYTVNANWIGLSAFVALGMILSAITDTCGMAILLSKMPWNTVSGQDTCGLKKK